MVQEMQMSYTRKLILAGCAALLCTPVLAQTTPAAVKQIALTAEAAPVKTISEVAVEAGDAESKSSDGSEYRRSADERVYEAAIISVRAVMKLPEQRCWVEAAATPGKVDAAEEIIGREPASSQVISRCQSVQAGSPDYWDVTYRFRNVEHTVQMSAAPALVMHVNKRGEPRL
jgi:hypothetical protein